MSIRTGQGRVPDSGAMLVRPRITALIRAAGDRPVVLAGSPGCGKSIAVEHHAGASKSPVLWLSLGGRSPSCAETLEMILQAKGGRSPRGGAPGDPHHPEPCSIRGVDEIGWVEAKFRAIWPDGVLLVLDDHGGNDELELTSILDRIAALRTVGVCLIVTTRSERPFRSRASALVITGSQLKFSLEETRELIGMLGGQVPGEEDVDALHRMCGGHPSLLSTTLLSGIQSVDGHDPCAAVRVGIRRLVRSITDQRSRECVALAGLVGSGTVSELQTAGIPEAREILRRMADMTPLVRLRTVGSRTLADFEVDGLVRTVIQEEIASQEGSEVANRLSESALDILTRRHEWRACMDIVGQIRDVETVIEWLERWGADCLNERLANELSATIDRLPMDATMGRPMLLALWAECAWDSGRLHDALSTFRAARVLLLHEDDRESCRRVTARMADILRLLGRIDEARALLEEVVPLTIPNEITGGLAEAYRVSAIISILDGEYEHAEMLLERITRPNLPVLEGDPGIINELKVLLALLPSFTRGDFKASSNLIAPIVTNAGGKRWEATGGDLAMCLVQNGRLDRAVSILDGIVERIEKPHAISYFVARGCAACGEGNEAEALEAMESALRCSFGTGDESLSAVIRIYQSIILRSEHRNEESLTAAERAYDVLASRKCMDYRFVATLEVAASLLSSGDGAAARTMVQAAIEATGSYAPHHALRVAMILAECDRLDGDTDSGTARLAPCYEQVASGNANWQMAMYIRAFPGLLMMLAMSCGVRNLPMHMLRMLLPQHATACLAIARESMSPSDVAELGRRMLGEDQFNLLVEAHDDPPCRVRVFGSLHVSVCGHVIEERAWHKRKARLLFAMLVVRRGMDVPRDVLFDHLWPEMDEGCATNNFYVAWSAMKGALMGRADRSTPCPYIENARGRCRIRPETVRCDLDEFDELEVSAKEAEGAGKPRAAIAAYERLATVYRADLLPGDLYEDWFASLRDEYRRKFVDAMGRAAGLSLEAGDPQEGITFIRKGLAVDPLREDLYQLALRCHILTGQRSEAVDAFMQCKANLCDGLGFDPSENTLKLYEEVLSLEEYSTFRASGARAIKSR